MSKIEITRKMMEAAKDYIPLAIKEAWAADCGAKCFDRLAITADEEPMPPMYMVNYGLKSRYLMAVLAGMYFGAEYTPDEKDPALMGVEDYDAWAGSHVLNQIERWKFDAALKSKAFDILYDYKDMEKRISSQISGLLAVQNDFVIRQSEYMANQIKQFPQLLEQMKELQGKGDASGKSNS